MKLFDPAVTRKKIISALNALNNKWVKVPCKESMGICRCKAQGTGHRAQGTGHKGTGHRA